MFREFRFAARTLGRWRGGGVVAVLTLATGIGAATALSALIHVLRAELPGVPDPASVGRIYAASRSMGVDRAPVALTEFTTILATAPPFEAIGAYAQARATLASGDTHRSITAGYASPGFLRALAVAPAAGRAFTEDDLRSARRIAILSDHLWRTEFPDGRVDGARLSINGIDYDVAGVMPPEFTYPFAGVDADVWLPLGAASRDVPAIVTVFGRLRPGTTWIAANAALGSLASTSRAWTWHAIPLDADARSRASSAYRLTVVPAIAILLIACVNVTCLLLARGMTRERELSMRRALGASRRRVAACLLAEHVLLAGAAAALGWGAAARLLSLASSTLTRAEPALAGRIPHGATLMPIVFGMTMAAVLISVLPVLRLSSRAASTASDGIPRGVGRDLAPYGPRDLIVFFEVASAAGLVVAAAMLFGLFRSMHDVKPAFDAGHVVSIWVPPDEAAGIAARIAEVPGITSVTMSSGSLGGFGRASVRARAGDRDAAVSLVPIGDGFLAALGVPLLRGRTLSGIDVSTHARVVMLTESAARALFGDADPLGAAIATSGHAGGALMVVGICRDAVDYGRLGHAGLVAPDAYVPFEQNGSDPVILARVAGDGPSYLHAIEAAARPRPGTRAPRAALLSDEIATGDRSASDLITRTVGTLAAIALLLALSGVGAVAHQSVVERTREFGIRMAIGATRGAVWRMVLEREARLLGLALASGGGMTFLLTRLIFAELARFGAAAPMTWAVPLALCGATAALACLAATWRVVHLDPAVVLRRS